MICLKSPKSFEFAFFSTNRGQKSLTMFFHYVLTTVQLNFKNSEIKKKEFGFEPWGLRLRNICAKKTAQKRLKITNL